MRRDLLNQLDDIPEAHREILLTSNPGKASFKGGWLVILLLGVILSGGLGWWLLSRSFATATEQESMVAEQITDEGPDASGQETLKNQDSDIALQTGSGAESLEGANSDIADATGAASSLSESDLQSIEDQVDQATLLGHRKYEVADQNNLVALSGNSLVKLKPAAAQKVEALLEKARIEGIQLGAVSGYRTLEDQHFLFFEVKANRGQNSVTRAEVSAPPGYSEHHTGYAIDFVDRSRPETDLEVTFDQTPAFEWLQRNAARFGLEMSFEKGNTDVSYEPWHWRYVGDSESLETFYQE